MRGKRGGGGGGRNGLRKVETDVSSSLPSPSVLSDTHPSFPSRCCIPVQTVTSQLVLLASLYSKTYVRRLFKGTRSSQGGNVGVEVLSVRGGGLELIFVVESQFNCFCSVLLIKQSNHAVVEPRPNQASAPLQSQAQTCSKL